MSIYRKYRPKKFEDVLGQENVVQTLRGALLSGQVSHAYIFSGIRGTGKTSIARIFARAVNCLDPKDHEPCGECDICKEIDSGSFLDLIEIDAASNRGIEDIRDLREKVRFSPNRGKYKVYIIDEVHMLTNEAFNALLKTLEEPPAHAIFILATTEIHKIPQTILSRCQRLDFGKINREKMVDGIKKVSEKEGIKIDEKSALKIAVLSEGSVRDAFSYLDQISSFSGGEDIDLKKLEDVLGISSEERIVEFLNLVWKRDRDSLVRYFSSLEHGGVDFENFIKDVIKFLRGFMIYKVSGDDSLFIDKNIIEPLKDAYSFEELVEFIEFLNGISRDTRNHFIPQLPLEVGILSRIRKPSGSNAETLPQTQESDLAKKEKPVSSKENNSEPEEAESTTIPENKDSSNTQGSTNGFIEKLKDRKVVLYSIIRNCEIIEEEGNVVFCTNNAFYYDTINKRENLDSIREILNEENINKDVLVKKNNESLRKEKNIVESAISVFGGEIID